MVELNSVDWRDIPGYGGRYKVSPEGLILSTGRSEPYQGRWGTTTRRTTKPRLLKLALASNGYLFAGLYRREDGRKSVNGYVHRLVAEAFVANPQGLPQVNHIDGDRQNNAASNLEWVTASGNHLHRCRTLKRGAVGEAHHKAKLTLEQVEEIRASEGTCRAVAKVYGVSYSTIALIRKGKIWVTHD